MAEDRRDLFGAGGPDAAPNPSHLREKTAEELLNELEVELDDMSEADYDQARVDAYLDELDRREPPGADAAAEPALERFHAAHAAASHMARRQRGRAMKTAACRILVCGLSLGGLLAVSPGVRAWTKNVFVQWFEDYFYIAYAGQQAEGVKASDWRPAYVPDGFETVDTQDEAFSITYENSDGVWIKFRCTTVAVAGDSERGTFSEITVQGKPAMLMLADAPGDWNAVTWADEEYGFLFDITSSYDYKELIRMAESVELVLEPE